MVSSKTLQAIAKPQTKAGRRILRWIDLDATEDRMLYAVIGHGPTVAALRATILDIEREASQLDTERLGRVLYEMGVDDLDLPDAQELAAHIVTRCASSEHAA